VTKQEEKESSENIPVAPSGGPSNRISAQQARGRADRTPRVLWWRVSATFDAILHEEAKPRPTRPGVPSRLTPNSTHGEIVSPKDPSFRAPSRRGRRKNSSRNVSLGPPIAPKSYLQCIFSKFDWGNKPEPPFGRMMVKTTFTEERPGSSRQGVTKAPFVRNHGDKRLSGKTALRRSGRTAVCINLHWHSRDFEITKAA
jgi:hypothetical protein